ncbi:hypothetical protein KSE_16030 [Kitasatospora setae KM-6054]|uniref:Uncharacterized protein n=1 Tax=Kitasatospora setae (strain ATCC 33774 / DSM 43861 / JCM 3304 / KCC A-0304 / NBRC 14216 / KM-6054) TaxID=452652 RepID=E4N899_KITSK|nr:hypothetical protein KSE_16030 [Kitasatospora setae KM-6054]
MTGALVVAVALGPAALVALGAFDSGPHGGVWWFFGLAVAMLGVVDGGDWEACWRRRRAVRRSRLRIRVRHVRSGGPP